MSKARQLADLGNVYDDGALSNRNLIINGAMQVAQRGTSLSISGSQYLIDRFRSYRSHTATATVSQSSDAPTGFTKSWLITIGTGAAASAANELQVAQGIEGYNTIQLGLGTAGAKVFTVSFWVKSSLTGDFSIAFQSQSAADHYITTYNISSANTWEYKTITVQGATSGTFDKTTSTGISVIFDLGSGSNLEATADVWSTGNKVRKAGTVAVAATSSATWQITGVQLEVGDTATPFEHRSYGDELARCQRYYQISLYETNASTGTYYAYYNKFYGCQLPFFAMRATPSVSYNHTSGAFYWVNPGVQAFSAQSTTGFSYNAYGGVNGFGAIYFEQVRQTGNSTPTDYNSYRLEAKIEFLLDAEL